jgi:peptidyl-prolyl cis-trans isomerase A (cyclophilin A)
MRRGRPQLSTLLLLGTLSGAILTSTSGKALGYQATKDDDHPVVVIDTTAGPITVELDRTKAPISVENFLKYVDKGFYEGLAFHRVMPGFMIQTGGMQDVDGTLQEKKEGAFPPIKNESSNGLRHVRGSLAMARTPRPDSATSQFFINHNNNRGLDTAPGGYAVFGKVIDGMDVVDAIAKVPTTTKKDVKIDPSTGKPMEHENVPVKPIVIKSAKRKAQS